MCSVVVVLPASIWAMTPMLRKCGRSSLAMVLYSSFHHRGTEDTKAHRGIVSVRLCVLCASVVNEAFTLPREVGKGLVRLGHLDGVLAFGHGLALAAVGGHELVGQAQEHGPARLAARGADDPADSQALLAAL